MDLSKFLPSLVESSPKDGQTDVPLNQVVELKFSVPLHPAIMSSGQLDQYIIVSDVETDEPLRINLVYPPSPVQSDVVRFDFQSPGLQPGRKYMITILPDLPAFTGRKAGVRRTVTFETTSLATIVGVPTLLEPGDNTMHTDPVEFSWEPLASFSGIYEIQVSADRGFDSGLSWTTTTSTSTVQVPLGTFTSRDYYYWRVRAIDTNQTPAVTGSWSDVWGFYYVSEQDLPAESLIIAQAQLPDSGPLLAHSLEKYVDNMFTSWPLIEFYFVGITPADVDVILERRSLESYPHWGYQPVTFATSVNTSPSTSDVDNWLGFWLSEHGMESLPAGFLFSVIVPSDPFLPNSVYAVTLKAGSRRYRFEFVSYYDPFYANPDNVLALTEGLLGEITDRKDLHFLIYRRSLDANRHYIRWWGTTSYWGIAGPQESTVRSIRIGHFYAVQRWVEYATACDLLRRRLMELSAVVGQNRRLGDYNESNEAYALGQIRQLLKDLQKEAEIWLAEFSKMRGVIETGSKSLTGAWKQKIFQNPAMPSRDWRS